MNETPAIRSRENAFFGPAPAHPRFRLEEPPHPVFIAGLRRMTAAQKFRQMEEMYRWCVAVKRAQISRHCPSWSEELIEREARRAVMYAPD